MKDAVKPKMKPIFQAFDGKKFKDFDCDNVPRRGPRRGTSRSRSLELLPVERLEDRPHLRLDASFMYAFFCP